MSSSMDHFLPKEPPPHRTKIKRDPARIERILDLIKEYWSRPENNDSRLAQLISNFADRKDLYYFEDNLLEIQLKEALLDK